MPCVSSCRMVSWTDSQSLAFVDPCEVGLQPRMGSDGPLGIFHLLPSSTSPHKLLNLFSPFCVCPGVPISGLGTEEDHDCPNLAAQGRERHPPLCWDRPWGSWPLLIPPPGCAWGSPSGPARSRPARPLWCHVHHSELAGTPCSAPSPAYKGQGGASVHGSLIPVWVPTDLPSSWTTLSLGFYCYMSLTSYPCLPHSVLLSADTGAVPVTR